MIKNALVLMSKSGDLYVGVLGTEPSLFTAPRPEARQVNYEETDIEMAALNSIIKTAQNEGMHIFTQFHKSVGNFGQFEIFCVFLQLGQFCQFGPFFAISTVFGPIEPFCFSKPFCKCQPVRCVK